MRMKSCTEGEKKRTIVLLSGGSSPEREISISTSQEILKSLKQLNFEVTVLDPSNFSCWYDFILEIKKVSPFIVFNGLHGSEGEDGKVQAILELEKISYTGSKFQSSVLCMDKNISSILVASKGVPVPDYFIFRCDNRDETVNNVLKDYISSIGFPLVLKPNNSGSSVGIYICNDEDEVFENIIHCQKVSNEVILQKFISGRELTVTVLGSEILPVVEIKVNKGWYDYQNKYTKGNTVYEVPAKLTRVEERKIKRFAMQAYRVLKCKAYARVDFRYDGERFYFLEANTLPGMTALSLTPMAAKAAGIDFDNLILRIINNSIDFF